eukprot:507318-Alexandrium_andersonii.AAC.1
MGARRVPLAALTAARASAEARARTPLVLIAEPRTGRDRRMPDAEAAAGADAMASCAAAPG